MKVKTFAVVLCVVLCFFYFSVYADSTVTSVNKFVSGFQNKTEEHFAFCQFKPSHEIEKGEGFNLKKGKYVNQAYVIAKSAGKKIGGVTICNSYSTGRLWSKKANKKTNQIIQTPEARVKRCWTCLQTLNYDWRYF